MTVYRLTQLVISVQFKWVLNQLYNLMSQEENPNNAPFSLIKYEAEIQISDNVQEYEKAKDNQKSLDAKPNPEDVLNNMILPRDWKDNETNKHFMQYVSHQKAEREDLLKIKEALDRSLEYRQARTEGICPIREELISQTFDEIIRQVTINSPERGLLLMRVRDEHKMSLAAYQTLYQSSVGFGMRKLLEAEEGMQDLSALLQESSLQKQSLARKKVELQSKKQSLQKKIQQRKDEESSEREQGLIQIQEQQGFLSKFLSSLQEAGRAD